MRWGALWTGHPSITGSTLGHTRKTAMLPHTHLESSIKPIPTTFLWNRAQPEKTPSSEIRTRDLPAMRQQSLPN